MATAPAFAATPVASGIISGTSASTTFTTPANPVTVYTAPSSGARIDEITIAGLASTAANVVCLYVYNGTTYWLIKAVPTTATTISASTPPFTASVTFNNLFLPNASYSIRASQYATESVGYMITAFGGSF